MKDFLKEVKLEFDKVTWPNKNELKDSTIVTIGVTVAFTLYIYAADTLISYLVTFLYGIN